MPPPPGWGLCGWVAASQRGGQDPSGSVPGGRRPLASAFHEPADSKIGGLVGRRQHPVKRGPYR